MATYTAVMRPALEYASSVWSPIAFSTSINKLQVMQNANLYLWNLSNIIQIPYLCICLLCIVFACILFIQPIYVFYIYCFVVWA